MMILQITCGEPAAKMVVARENYKSRTGTCDARHRHFRLLHVHNLWALGGFSVDTLRSTLLNYHIAQRLWLLMLKEDLAFKQSTFEWMFEYSHILLFLQCAYNTYTSSLAHQQSPLMHVTAGHYLIATTQSFTCAAMFAVPWALCSELSTW